MGKVNISIPNELALDIYKIASKIASLRKIIKNEDKLLIIFDELVNEYLKSLSEKEIEKKRKKIVRQIRKINTAQGFAKKIKQKIETYKKEVKRWGK